MKQFGVVDEDVTNGMLITLAMLKEATKGNVSAYKMLADQAEPLVDSDKEPPPDPLTISLKDLAKGVKNDK